MFEGDPQENLKRDLRRVADDIAAMREALLEGKREHVERFKETAKERFTEASQQARAKAHEVDSYVHENPWLAAGIAAAAGIVLGALLGRGKRH
jgi:ElaB/YqjD/DUF883 family membrane-anchored ribosome-binding protein